MRTDREDSRELNKNEIIHQIVYQIKHNQNYSEATKMMKENNITLNVLIEKTFKLSQKEIAKLTDTIIESR